ncbi:putative RNA methyltransferase [Modestobacter roseus]|uniref:23S rRNA m(1)G-748 methyltransferase n=1 Tax=Modestobacter roseus TaxID=1181884 RepID=A0A562ILU8_9ACTN|nr:methyltransferase domain-containing protein [Modestobacter roseus]MQA34243.1 methyltransferase domain-containing protein [Modestobacter roseus]TWH71920.1 23S rRNA m(1)G-748 methyltransferase [Modestobacter roseus]
MTRPLPPAAVAVLACPVCGAALHEQPAGLGCADGHAFDRARQGHVTLLPAGGSPHAGDSAAMVADRAEFLAAGHYAGITAALARAALDGPPVRTLLDAGGGTGAHLAGVLERAPGAVGVVLDASRYAARRAARAHPQAMAVVADSWSRWPVRDAAVDRVLVVFAPRNGAETARVLRPGGRLVVVTPAAEHLASLVGPLGLLTVDPAKADRLAAALEPHLAPVAAVRHREELLLDHAAVRTLVGMGPHARHLAPGELAARVAALPEPVRVPVAVDVTSWTAVGPPAHDEGPASVAGPSS